MPFGKHSSMGMKISRFVQKPVSLQAAAGLNGQDPAGPPRSGQSSAPRGLLALRQRGGEDTGSAVPSLEAWSSFLGQTARCGRRVISQA